MTPTIEQVISEIQVWASRSAMLDDPCLGAWLEAV